MIWTALIVFAVCMISGMPIVYALGIPGVVYILMSGMPLTMVAAKMFSGVDVYVLMAIPLFIITGNLMNHSGISRRLVRFSVAIVGSLPGGLAMVNIVASMFMAGVTGAGSAEVAGLGSILIPAMREEGYEDGFSVALITISSSMGPIIPPSILFVVYGYLANVSIASLFLAGIVPGVMIGVFLMVTVYVLARKHHYPRGDRFSFNVVAREFKSASLALSLPLLIVAGMAFGVMTPTEVSGMSVLLAFVVGKFIYRELRWVDIPQVLVDSAIMSGAVVFIVATNNILLYAVTLEQLADKIGAAFFAITQSKILILLMLNVLLLLLGAIVDCLPLMIMFIPVIKPLFAQLGIDPIHAGVFVVLNMVIGLATPPVGTSLFIATSIARIDLQTAARHMMPFLLAIICVLFLVTYFPPVTLWIPHLVMGN